MNTECSCWDDCATFNTWFWDTDRVQIHICYYFYNTSWQITDDYLFRHAISTLFGHSLTLTISYSCTDKWFSRRGSQEVLSMRSFRMNTWWRIRWIDDQLILHDVESPFFFAFSISNYAVDKWWKSNFIHNIRTYWAHKYLNKYMNLSVIDYFPSRSSTSVGRFKWSTSNLFERILSRILSNSSWSNSFTISYKTLKWVDHSRWMIVFSGWCCIDRISSGDLVQFEWTSEIDDEYSQCIRRSRHVRIKMSYW